MSGFDRIDADLSLTFLTSAQVMGWSLFATRMLRERPQTESLGRDRAVRKVGVELVWLPAELPS